MKDGKNDIIVSSNNQNYNSDDYSRPDRGSEMKILSNRWSDIVDWSIEKGTHHFAITINTLESNNFIYNDNYGVNNLYAKISKLMIRNFPTLVFMQIVTEMNKKDMAHFHIIVGIRNFMDYNYTLKNNIFIVLNRDLVREGESDPLGYGTKFDYEFDIQVKSLRYFKDVKNWAMYLYKDMYKWNYPSYVYFNKCFWNTPKEYACNNNNERFVNKIYNCLNAFIALMHDYGTSEIKLELIIIEDESIHSDIINNLTGIKLNLNKFDRNIILNLIEYYLIFNNYYISNDNIYQKLKEFNISYELVGTVMDILYKGFKENVIPFFINNFSNYFESFDFQYLLMNHLMNSKYIIRDIIELTTNKIKLDFSLMEFTDGIYSISLNTFIPLKNIKDKVINKATVKFYRKSYRHTRRERPELWIKCITNALGLEEKKIIELDKSFIKIAKSVGLIFQEDSIKQSTLFIHGPSDSGKTLLLANILLEYFGSENVGSMVSAKNFKWQDFENKKIGIIDEGRYNPSMSSDLLKLTGKENIKVEKKYSEKHITISSIPLFILSNILFNDKDKDINDALYRRMLVIKFISSLYLKNIDSNLNLKKDIKLEEANIIIFCNKIFFRHFKEKKVYKNFKNILKIE